MTYVQVSVWLCILQLFCLDTNLDAEILQFPTCCLQQWVSPLQIPEPHLDEWLGGRPSGPRSEVRNPLAGSRLLAAAMRDPRE